MKPKVGSLKRSTKQTLARLTKTKKGKTQIAKIMKQGHF